MSEPKSRKALPHTGTSKIAIQTVTLAIHNQGVTQQADVAYELVQKYWKYRIEEADSFTE